MRLYRSYRAAYWSALVVAQLGVLGVIGLSTMRHTSAQPLRDSHAAMAQMDMASLAAARSPQVAVVRLHQRVVRLSIQNLSFQPARIVVSPGTRIVWTNKDGFAHTVTSDKGIWSSGDVNSQRQFARTFAKAGTFAYHCSIHPFMHGTVTVRQ